VRRLLVQYRVRSTSGLPPTGQRAGYLSGVCKPPTRCFQISTISKHHKSRTNSKVHLQLQNNNNRKKGERKKKKTYRRNMDPNLPNPDDDKTPSTINYILSFLLVGIAWGFTTPFIRRAAVDFSKRQEQSSSSTTATTTAAASTTNRSLNPSASSSSWIKTKLITITWTVFNLLRTPAYAIPLLVNLSGSIWFFLLVGKHGMCCCCF
jgi:hypothetical protein